MTEEGNLILLDKNNSTIWQSFDRPTDTLVFGQKLVLGQKLTANISATYSIQGLFSISITNNGLVAYIETNPPQIYYKEAIFRTQKLSRKQSYLEFRNSVMACSNASLPIPYASTTQYMKLGADGHLRVYSLLDTVWVEEVDLLKDYIDVCGYTTVCGKYGICSNGQCCCPNQSIYFRDLVDRRPSLGCSEVTPLSCEASEYHGFVELNDITYFTFRTDINSKDVEICKQACLKNCSCKAVFFKHFWNSPEGECYLPNEIFSLINYDGSWIGYNFSAFLKVQLTPSLQSFPIPEKKNKRIVGIIGSSLGAFFILLVTIGSWVSLFGGKRILKLMMTRIILLKYQE